MRAIISRFAPAPTGSLHLGHVVNADYVWGETRARCGRVLLRIEDHDRRRSHRRFEKAILGRSGVARVRGRPDAGPAERARTCTRRRSTGCGEADWSMPAIVRARKSINARQASATEGAGDVGGRPCGLRNCDRAPLSGYVPTRGLDEGPGVGLRVQLEPSMERFVDLRIGSAGTATVRAVRRPPRPRSRRQLDLSVRGRSGRLRPGRDARDPRRRSARVDRPPDPAGTAARPQDPATFLHHPLIMKSPDQKLSKSDSDTGIWELRARGWTPARDRARWRSSRLAARDARSVFTAEP